MCRSCALEACSRRDRLVQSSNHDMQFHAYLKLSTSRRRHSAASSDTRSVAERNRLCNRASKRETNFPPTNPCFRLWMFCMHQCAGCMRAGVEPHGSLTRYEFRQRHMLTKLTRALRHESWHGPKQSLPITFGYSTHALNTHR